MSGLDECIRRDPKGLYEFTGISAPYEQPESAELTVETDAESVDESVKRILTTMDGEE